MKTTRAVLLSPKRRRMPFLERVAVGLSWLREQYGCTEIPPSEAAKEYFPVDHPALFHWYQLNAPASEEEVSAFEREHGISLPLDYRSFITNLGNGGVGVDVGGLNVLGFLESRSEATESAPWRSGDGNVGVLARPFPLKKNWNLPKKELAKLDHANADYSGYFAQVDGAIPICDAGCGSYWWLVVSGPQAGHIWHDRRADRLGWTSANVTFSDWYLDWLDDAIANAPEQPLRWEA